MKGTLRIGWNNTTDETINNITKYSRESFKLMIQVFLEEILPLEENK